ncbi:MAG: hypothetical protein KF874_03110 [Rhizobiaceae bacterium]|nr:hypothetical protein [Rhizobiaceae bacterium]
MAPLITLSSNLYRPEGVNTDAFAGAGVAQVLDALGLKTALDYTIKPLAGQAGQKTGYLGPALTVKASPGDNLGVYAAIHNAKPGDVLVISTTNYTGTGLMGDLMLMMARNRGIAAIVTDGLIRDSVGMRPVPVPIYCRGVSPNAPSRAAPAAIGFPISIGGVIVNQGDMVFGDPDGVVIVSPDRASELSEKLPQLLALEQAFEKDLDAGMILKPEIAAFIEQNTSVVDA